MMAAAPRPRLAAEHEERGLVPRPSAPKAILLRRVFLDLIGLSPTPDEQLRRWAAGDSVCPNSRHECCPDFSCCKPRLGWPRDPHLIVIADRLRDPGNLGTLLRSSAAAGVSGVLLAPETVEAFNPKVVRGAMGAHFRLPILEAEWAAIADRVRGLNVYVAEADGSRSYTSIDWTRPAALIIGGRFGLTAVLPLEGWETICVTLATAGDGVAIGGRSASVTGRATVATSAPSHAQRVGACSRPATRSIAKAPKPSNPPRAHP
jgi:hypothetical protein